MLSGKVPNSVLKPLFISEVDKIYKERERGRGRGGAVDDEDEGNDVPMSGLIEGLLQSVFIALSFLYFQVMTVCYC